MAMMESARIRDWIEGRFEFPHLHSLREAPYALRLDDKAIGDPFERVVSREPGERVRGDRAPPWRVSRYAGYGVQSGPERSGENTRKVPVEK